MSSTNDSVPSGTGWGIITAPSELQAKRLLRMIYCLIVALLLYAWGPTVKGLFSAVIWPTINSQEQDANEFLALVYDEESFPKGSRFATRLKEHILTLQSEGYTPLRLKDAEGLIKKNQPVAEKSVLLTFDFNKLTVYPQIEAVLRETGWFATAFYCTKPNESQRSDIRLLSSMKRSSHWEIAARSHRGYERVPDPTINEFVRYLSAYQWLHSEKRHENTEEFRIRVHGDHQDSLVVFDRRLNLRPSAYAYPFGDFGQLDDGTEEIRQINQLEASRHFPLAFTRGELALNNRGTDPVRLNRLHVKPTWNGRALADRLGRDIRSVGLISNAGMGQSSGAWVLEKGYISLEDTATHLRTDNLGREAAAWYASPGLNQEYNAVMDFSWDKGDFLVYFQHTESPSTYSRIRFSTNQVATLEQKRPLEPVRTMEQVEAKIQTGLTNSLKLFLRGKRVHVRLNGVNVFGHGVELTNVDTHPRFGIGLVPNRGDVSNARIHHVALRDALSRMATWSSATTQEGQAIDWLHENAGRLTHVCPPMELDIEDLTFIDSPFQSIRMLANVYNMQFIPKITLTTGDEMDRLNSFSLAELMASSSMDGLFLDLSALTDLSIKRIQLWLQQSSQPHQDTQADLYIKLPPNLEDIVPLQNKFKQAPHLYLVSTKLNESADAPGKFLRIEDITENTTSHRKIDRNQIQLLDEPESLSVDEITHRIRLLQVQSEKALTEGEHEKAIVSLSEWHELSPADSQPITMIAEALYSLGYKEESLDFYRQSLDVNPGQVKLVARLTEIFSYMNHDEEARNLLNLYVRLFPEDPDILYAQALWLIDQDRLDEADGRLELILKKRPLDFQTLLLKLRISSDAAARKTTLGKLKQLAENPDRHLDLVEAVQKYDLLTLSDSHVVVEILHDIEATNPDPKIADRIHRVLPRFQTITENLSDGQLSANWEAEGGRIVSAIDGIELKSLPSQPEVTLRLLRSQQFNDSFIHAKFKDVRDSVWIYGRRSVENLVRFGVDTESKELHLQIWKDKNRRIHSGHRETLESLPNEIDLRLEIRGNGVVGYLNGREVVSVPLELPGQINHGWMAVSVQSADRGQARATITELEAGPLPLQLAMLPQTPAEGEIASEELQKIRSLLGNVTDASPDWFELTSEGKWKSDIDPADDFFRLFSRYYRIRLVPLVQVATDAIVTVSDIEYITNEHSLDGVVLRFAQQPDNAWRETFRKELNEKELYVYTVMDSSVEGRARIEGFGRAAFLFEKKQGTIDVNVRDINKYQADLQADGPNKKPTLISVN